MVGRIKHIDRPGLMSTLPTMDGKGFDMMDLGANAENTAHHLYQYGILGSFYAEHVRGVKQPRVGLLNNGTEDTKGTPVHQEAYKLLAEDKSINFIGNVEARELLQQRGGCGRDGWFHGKRCAENHRGYSKIHRWSVDWLNQEWWSAC